LSAVTTLCRALDHRSSGLDGLHKTRSFPREDPRSMRFTINQPNVGQKFAFAASVCLADTSIRNY
jgi:hypothetical protein